jgi:hypothetical protein
VEIVDMPQPPKGRKPKPKFEVPSEMEAPEATAAWAYRTEESPGAVVVPITAVPATPALGPVDPPAAPERVKPHAFIMAGTGLVFIGVGTAGLFSLMAFELISGPIRAARRLFGFHQK